MIILLFTILLAMVCYHIVVILHCITHSQEKVFCTVCGKRNNHKQCAKCKKNRFPLVRFYYQQKNRCCDDKTRCWGALRSFSYMRYLQKTLIPCKKCHSIYCIWAIHKV